MRALIVYESMYGNTHRIADAIAQGFSRSDTVTVLPAHLVSEDAVEAADLVVVGGPTHAHGMARASTRRAAADAVQKHPEKMELEPDALSTGVREWLEQLPPIHAPVAAFDTRMHGPALFTGRAAKGIAKRLRRRGGALIAPVESFIVTKTNHLAPGEGARAQEWGRQLASAVERRRTNKAA